MIDSAHRVDGHCGQPAAVATVAVAGPGGLGPSGGQTLQIGGIDAAQCPPEGGLANRVATESGEQCTHRGGVVTK